MSGWLRSNGKGVVKDGAHGMTWATCYLGVALAVAENIGERMGS